MRIGIKLDLGFSDNAVYRDLFGGHEVLDRLRDIGVDAVETPMWPNTTEEAVIDQVHDCRDAGLRVSLHPYTERTPHNPAYFSLEEGNLCLGAHERFLAIASSTAQIQQAETVVNIHAAASTTSSRRELIDRSAQFFQWAGEWCRNQAPAVRVVAELQIAPLTGETMQRIGDNYAELMEVLQRSGVSACWDFGHAAMNARRFGQRLDPPEELLSRIVHVHCHDISHEDHQPLIFGNVPWERFLGKLSRNGFDGTVILEVPAKHFLASGGLDTLVRSIHALRSYTEEL